MKKIFIIFILTMLSACTKTDDYLHELAKKHSELLDPESAMFRNVVYESYPEQIWCGEINAKNKFGGYTGWKKFKIESNNHNVTFEIEATYDDYHEATYNSSQEQKKELEETVDVINRLKFFNCSEEKAPKYFFNW